MATVSLVGVLAACAPTAPTLGPSSALPSSPVAEMASPAPTSALTMADAARCPVSMPGDAPADIGDRLFGAGAAVGNGDLWVGGLGEDGVILADSRFVEADGSIGWKLGWWRVASGSLTITGRRLDADGPALRSAVPDGYGTSGFQASGVYFPTEGCWEVSGSLGASTLTFVTFVLRA